MSEVLKNSSGEKVGVNNRLEILENEAGKFNPEAAQKLKNEKASHLAVLQEKEQPKELSPYEEYRELVKELSVDLPDGKGSGANYGKETRVDAILASEISWRKNSEEMQDRAKIRDDSLKKIEQEYSKKGFLGKLFGRRKFEKQRDAIMNAYDDGYRKNKIFNERIQNDLAKAYGDRYEDEKKNNEMRNRQFFGYDNPERAAKVERAIQLRQSFEDTKEWQKESKTTGHMIRDLTIERQKKS